MIQTSASRTGQQFVQWLYRHNVTRSLQFSTWNTRLVRVLYCTARFRPSKHYSPYQNKLHSLNSQSRNCKRYNYRGRHYGQLTITDKHRCSFTLELIWHVISTLRVYLHIGRHGFSEEESRGRGSCSRRTGGRTAASGRPVAPPHFDWNTRLKASCASVLDIYRTGRNSPSTTPHVRT